MTVTIRGADRNDALHVLAIMDIAGHGIDAEYWRGVPDEDHSALAAARTSIIADPAMPYHLSRAHLLDLSGEVAGGLIAGMVEGDEADFPDLPAFLQPLVELESLAIGHFGINGIGVYREFRGRGYSRLLLSHAAGLARRAGARGLSLVVEDTNETALRLYRSEGFAETQSRPWLPYAGRTGPRRWVLMTRRLDG
jgi:ribosomal protein S18 acetylase RimI-like enzyme